MEKVLLVIIGLAFSINASASDWEFQGVPVCTDSSDVAGMSMIEDGDGGAIIVWIDGRYGGSIFAQKVDGAGKIQWTMNGVGVCTICNIGSSPASQYYPALISDGDGGAIITWCDYRSGTNWDVYAQRIDNAGNAQWATNGVGICTDTNYQTFINVVSDQSAGAIITWQKLGSPMNYFAQRINSAGAIQWTTNGVRVTNSDGVGQNSGYGVVSDGSGGAIIAFRQNYSYYENVYARRIDNSGTPMWGYWGTTITAAVGATAQDIKVVPSGTSAIVIWGNYATEYYTFAQFVNSSGVVQWTADGINIFPWVSSSMVVKSDGNNGAVIAMPVSDSDYDLYAQRIDSAGVKLWDATPYGILAISDDDRQAPLDFSIGDDGIVFTCSDLNGAVKRDVLAQKIDMSGNIEWGSVKGVSVCVRDEFQYDPKIVSDEMGGGIIAWVDERNGNKDIYAQSVKTLHVSSGDPFYSLPGKIFNVSISGTGFVHTPEIKLLRSGGQETTAANVNQSVYELLNCTFDTTGFTPGVYNIQVSLENYSATLAKGFFILDGINAPVEWTMTDRGQLGNPSLAGFFYGITVCDGDNDGCQEVFVANRDQKIFYLDNYTSGWNITSLPSSPLGEYCSSFIVCDADYDNEKEVYVATLSNNVYQFEGAGWTQTIVGTTTEKVYSLAGGDVDLDGVNELYAACADGNIYRFVKKTVWERTIVGTAPDQVFALSVGDGDSDGLKELYAACADNKVYQFECNGTSWSDTEVGAGSGDMFSVTTGDGNRDGQMEVYGANEDGKIYQFKWLVSSWGRTEVGQSTLKMYDVKVSDAENSGENAVYAVCEDGHLYQYKSNATQWGGTDLGNAGTPLYKLDIGDGDNDNQFEIYTIGGDNHVREFKADSLVPGPSPTATPTSTPTPIPGFDGRVISEKYIYAAPNPVRGNVAKIVIFTNQAAEVSGKLFTTSNQEVLSFNRYYGSTGKHEENINISNLANGVYLLFISAKGMDGTKEKVIKKIALIQ